MVGSGVITDKGKELMVKRLYLSSVSPVSKFKVGTGQSEPTVSDTDLQNPVLFKDIEDGDITYDESSKTITIRARISANEANGSYISEAGEFNSDNSPVMTSRDIFEPITKTGSDELTIIWRHKILL